MSDKQKSWLLSIATAVAGIIFTVAAANFIERSTRHHAKEQFSALSDILDLELQKRLQRFEVGLHNFEGLFLASKSVEYDEFNKMFSAIDLSHSYPGALGIGFIERVPNTPDAIAHFKGELLQQGAPPFEVHNVSSHFDSHASRTDNDTEEQRDDLYLVKFIQPIELNRKSLGMDIASEAARQYAAQQAHSTGQAKITKRLSLVQSVHEESGFLYLLPVFKPTSELPSNEETFLGWVFMPVVIEHAVEGIEKLTSNQLAFEIFEDQSIEDRNLICRSPNFSQNPQLDFQQDYRMNIGGQPWLLRTFPSENYDHANQSYSGQILFAGIILSLALGWIIKRLSSQASMAEELARSMTIELRRLAMVAKRTTNAVVITDTNRKVVWVNEAFTTLTGYTAEEILGKVPGRVLQSPKTDPETIGQIRAALTAGGGFCGEILNRDKNGEDYWVSIDIQPMHDEDGTPVGYMAIELDVTERKRAAELLEVETQRTKMALDSGGLAIWDWDLQTDGLIVDERWERIIGPYDHEAGRFNKYWEDRIHPDDVDHYTQVVQNALEHGVVQGEWRYRNSNDEYVWVEVRGHIVNRNDEQVPTQMAGTIMEISARKMAEEALRDSEARAKAMFTQSSEAIFLFNNDGFIDVNPKTLELFGFESEDDIRPFHPADLSPPLQPNGEPSEQVAASIIEQFTRDGFAKFDWLHQRKTGETFMTDVSLALIDAERGIAMGIMRDVSERRELERQLSQAQKLESIGQLAAGVAHEINTPMQCVFSNIEYLQEAFDRVFNLTEAYRQLDRGDWPEETRQFIEQTEKRSKFDRVKGNISDATAESGEAARRVIEIVRAMKTMSHPGTTNKVSTDLNKLVQDAAVISRNRWKYVATLETHLDEELGGIPLLPAQLSQVMLNLIVNAADAIVEKLGSEPSSLGAIELITRRADDGVVIEVSDSGSGIPDHVRKRIFDPFFTTKEVGRGTGQGLAIAYDVIVNQHQGRIDVETTPGEGSRFVIWLPENPEPQSLQPELDSIGASEY